MSSTPYFWQGTGALLANHVLPALGGRDVRAVTHADVRDLLDHLADSDMGTGIDRVLATIRKLFSWAAERDYLESSPADGIRATVKELLRHELRVCLIGATR